MGNKLGWQPAYPEIHQNNDGTMDYNNPGMSKRFYAACAAMHGMLAASHTTKEKSIKLVIEESYLLADELLRQENL
jgi:hypothetical protein